MVPPPWASSRVKLIQTFYRHRLDPPTDIVESASFLVTFDAIRRHRAIGFLARMVARHFERDGLLRILPVKVAIELPPVGIIAMRSRPRTPTCEQMIEALRGAARQHLSGAPS